VGSSSANPNGRGRIFKDLTFEYLPIPETAKTTARVPTYGELGFTSVHYRDLPVHLDPEFRTFTYGHVKRGFGDIQSIHKLQRDDALFFYATLQKESEWAPYIIGYFRDLEWHDCREMSVEEILSFKMKGFSNNAHLKREEPHADFLIKGGENSEYLTKAFALTIEDNHLKLRDELEDIILTTTGKKIESGKPWFRWTLTCSKCRELIEAIEVIGNDHCEA
jgi:hypothetical protein